MLQLLHPAALWTLAALALPLVIHLRRPPPRTVRLGSLRFLENMSRAVRWRNPRWRERTLLLCPPSRVYSPRSSLLLAEPRWIDTSARRSAALGAARPDGGTRRATRSRAGTIVRAGRLRTPPPRPRFPRRSGPTRRRVRAHRHRTRSLVPVARGRRRTAGGLDADRVFTPGRLASLRGDRPVLDPLPGRVGTDHRRVDGERHATSLGLPTPPRERAPSRDAAIRAIDGVHASKTPTAPNAPPNPRP